MRGRLAQARTVKTSRTSIQDEPSPALSTRRSKLLQSGNIARDSPLNDSTSRQSSVSLDIYGLPFEDESDAARPAKRRRKEAAISPVESNFPRRVRKRPSPAQSSNASHSREPTSKHKQVPGIEISRENDESQSPVSEAASVLEPLPAIRQALRIDFNAKGGGKLIISNTATPAPSVPNSARPSPAPGISVTEAADLEEVSAAKQAKKIPGRRRNPHKDPRIEAAIRRQADLKKCYRTIARAMKPILVELSTRGINELEEDEETYKNYPEYQQVMEALDQAQQKRQRELDAQLTHGLKLNEKRFKQDTQYVQQKLADNIQELRDYHAMQMVKSIGAYHRENEYRQDPNFTEDDFEDEVPPLRHPDAYILPTDDPKYNLDPKYESRSRQSLLVTKAADHIGNLRKFGAEKTKLVNERKKGLDQYFGPAKSYKYKEPEYFTAALARRLAGISEQHESLDIEPSTSTPTNSISLLLQAIEHGTKSVAAPAHPITITETAKPDASFDALFEAIRLQEASTAATSSKGPKTDVAAVSSSRIKAAGSAPESARTSTADAEMLLDIVPNRTPAANDSMRRPVIQKSPTRPLSTSRIRFALGSESNASRSEPITAIPAVETAVSKTNSVSSGLRIADNSARNPPTMHHAKSPARSSVQQTSISSARVKDTNSPTLKTTNVSRQSTASEPSTSNQTAPQTPQELSSTLAPKDNSESETRALAAGILIDKESRLRAAYKSRNWFEEAKCLSTDMIEARKFFQLEDRSRPDRGEFWLILRQSRQKAWLHNARVRDRHKPPAARETSEGKVVRPLDFSGLGRYAHLDIPAPYADMMLSHGDDKLETIWTFADFHIPADAIRPLDRDIMMEVAELAVMARYKYHSMKWLAWKIYYREPHKYVTEDDQKRGFDEMLNEYKDNLKIAEDRLKRALRVWPAWLEKTKDRYKGGKPSLWSKP